MLRPSSESATLLQAARDLVPQIRQCADEIESSRRLPPALIEAIGRAGIWGMTLPKPFGAEVDPLTNMAVVEELSKADASVGWCVMIAAGTANAVAACMPDEHLQKIFGEKPFTIVSGLSLPNGIALPAEGGYRLTGRWPFGSGCQHCDYMVVASFLADENGVRIKDRYFEWVAMLLPRSELEIIDTWKTTGMRGTGSHDYTASDVLIPNERAFTHFGSRRKSSPIYTFPAFYLVNMPAVAFGVAESAMATLRGGIGGPFRADRQIKENPNPKLEALKEIAVAESEALVGSARAYVREIAEEIWTLQSEGKETSLRHRSLFRLSLANAFVACTEAVQLVYDTIGSDSIYESNPIERQFRDMQTMKHHGSVSYRVFGKCGQMLLGTDPVFPFF